MATVHRSVLGEVRGSLGDVVYRKVRGKVFIVKRPSSYTIPHDAVSIKTRKAFSVASSLASVINHIEILNPFWKKVLPAGSSVYHTILKSLYKTVTTTGVTSQTVLAPGSSDFNLRLISTSITAKALEVIAEPVEILPRRTVGKPAQVQLVAIASFCQSVKRRTPPVWLYAQCSEVQPCTKTEPLVFTIEFDKKLMQQRRLYSAHHFLLILVTLNERGIPLHHSNTFFFTDLRDTQQPFF